MLHGFTNHALAELLLIKQDREIGVAFGQEDQQRTFGCRVSPLRYIGGN